MAKKLYRVLSPVNHNGERYEIDAAIELEDKHARPLLDCGAIAVPPASEEEENSGKAKGKK